MRIPNAKLNRELLVVLFFIIIALVLTWPWARYFSSSAFGAGHPFIVIWRFWWYNYARDNGLAESFVPLIGAPSGSALTALVDPLLPFWLGNNLTRLLSDPVVAYNLLVFLSFPLSAYFTFLLVRHLTKNDWISFLAGLLFAFSPYHFGHLGQFSLAQIEVIPLFLLAFFKLRERVNVTRMIFFSLVTALTILTDYYYGYFAGLFLGFFFGWELIFLIVFRRSDWRKYLRFALASLTSLILCLLVVAPAVAPRFLQREKTAALGLPLRASLDDLIVHSARPWDYFLPSAQHPFFGGLTLAAKEKISANRSNYWFYLPQTTESNVFLGGTLILLALAAVGFWLKQRGWRRGSFVPAVFLTALTLAFISLPPDIFLGKNNEIHQLLLSYRLHQFFPMFRAYVRLGIWVLVLFLLLASLALAEIGANLSGVKRIFVFSLLAGLMIFEFAVPPAKYLYIFDRRPDVYSWLAQTPPETIVAEMPDFRHFGNCPACLLFQPYHRRGLYGPRQLFYYDFSSSAEEETPFVPGAGGPTEQIREEAVVAMKKSGVKYLLVPRRSSVRPALLADYPKTSYSPASFTSKLKLSRIFADAYVFAIP